MISAFVSLPVWPSVILQEPALNKMSSVTLGVITASAPLQLCLLITRRSNVKFDLLGVLLWMRTSTGKNHNRQKHCTVKGHVWAWCNKTKREHLFLTKSLYIQKLVSVDKAKCTVWTTHYNLENTSDVWQKNWATMDDCLLFVVVVVKSFYICAINQEK